MKKQNLYNFIFLATTMLGVSTAQAQNLNHFMNNAIQGVTEQVVGQVAKQMADQYKGTPYMEQNKNIKEPNQCPQHYPAGMPVITHVDKDKVYRRSFYLCESNYAVQLDPATKNPIWVAEVLRGKEQANTFIKRVDNFQPHPLVPKPAQSALSDYKGSGLDRGHMAPAADMLTEVAMNESFYLTNMVPQVGPNMNRGIWADLEEEVRKWSVKRGEVIVFSGPIYSYKNGQPLTMGKSQVWVPTHLYKIIFDPKKQESVAYLLPNVQVVTSKTRTLDKGNDHFPNTLPSNAVNCNSVCNINNFVVSVETVEQYLGVNLLPKVNQNIKKLKQPF